MAAADAVAAGPEAVRELPRRLGQRR